jgi:predicted DNA-binding transcriptional regulator AlpA
MAEPKTVVLALRREDAAKACGVSDETFDRHVRPTLPVVRLGSVRVYPVADIERWLREHAAAPAAELEMRLGRRDRDQVETR